jgi:predicted RNA-binding Zn-ribbon protein involved in translation (DUF1610 family)
MTQKKKEGIIMYCKNCGNQLADGTKFCPGCGAATGSELSSTNTARCPKCGGNNIDIQLHQENIGGNTVTTTKSRYKQKGHGCLWWLFIGWWWWMVDLFLWIFIFPIRLLAQIFKKKKYVGKSTSASSTVNKINYKTVYLCKSCGYHWEK